MLQAMAFGGTLGDSVQQRHCCISVSATAVRIQRFRSLAVILRICFSGRLFRSTSASLEQFQQFNFCVSRKQGYGNAAVCERECLWIGAVWHLGLLTSHGRCLHPAVTESAVVETTSQRQINLGRGRSSSLLPNAGGNIMIAKILKNNANEGLSFTSENIITEDDFCGFSTEYFSSILQRKYLSNPKLLPINQCFCFRHPEICHIRHYHLYSCQREYFWYGPAAASRGMFPHSRR